MSLGHRGWQISLAAGQQMRLKVLQDLPEKNKLHRMKPQVRNKISRARTQQDLPLAATNVDIVEVLVTHRQCEVIPWLRLVCCRRHTWSKRLKRRARWEKNVNELKYAPTHQRRVVTEAIFPGTPGPHQEPRAHAHQDLFYSLRKTSGYSLGLRHTPVEQCLNST